jgi:hypothetical protein
MSIPYGVEDEYIPLCRATLVILAAGTEINTTAAIFADWKALS